MFRGSAGVWNADAADWIKRVEANSGSVSTATANAVTTFCNAVDAAGIRDKFYRLNLFCGTGLNACLVPLYRAPSLSGTQYGNATDTNNGPFVSDDYVETGASGGLTGNGTSKYLNTGLSPSFAGSTGDIHAASFAMTLDLNSSLLGVFDTGAPILYIDFFVSPAGAVLYYTHNTVDYVFRQAPATPGFFLGTGIATRTIYKNGVSLSTATSGSNPNITTSDTVFVFGFNNNSVAAGFSDGRQAAYSFGLSMTATQVTAYNAAMQAFQTALGRNV
jgi:hypothetical protein